MNHIITSVADAISEAWDYATKGSLDQVVVLSGPEARELALEFQSEIISGGMNCRVATADSLVLDDGEPMPIEEGTVFIVSQYAGHILAKPSVSVSRFAYAE